MLDFRRVVKNRKIQPEAAFCPTKSLGLEWMNSNPRMQIAYYSFLAGPAYRLNDYISFYGLVGISHTKAKGDYEWRNSVGADESDGYLSESVSKKSTDFAYAAGVIINPWGNMSVNIGYEGTKADIYGKHSVNGFTVGVGYRF